ncbi:hypothetical protein [Thermococcus sp.]|uniref:hypothetical protein n=1 Tax=Thermococcus sp. TaxID=35749 RepID=UPI002620511A|nr:hypothetical protein [Thermococcus sp.]
MKPKKGFELRESRLVELLERGFDGKSALELRSALERVKKIVGKKGLLLLFEIPLLSAQEEIGLALQLLRNVV